MENTIYKWMIWGYPISGNLHFWRSFTFLQWRTPKNQPTCSCHFHVIFNREHRETTGLGYPNLENNVWGGDCSNVWLNCHNTGNFACPEWPWAMPMTSTFVYGSNPGTGYNKQHGCSYLPRMDKHDLICWCWNHCHWLKMPLADVTLLSFCSTDDVFYNQKASRQRRHHIVRVSNTWTTPKSIK